MLARIPTTPADPWQRRTSVDASNAAVDRHIAATKIQTSPTASVTRRAPTHAQDGRLPVAQICAPSEPTAVAVPNCAIRPST